jgi:catechol 2,3-dioxygenase-like lactoylglutathione lyase family enzyme
MTDGTRLRQVALVARHIEPVASRIQQELGLGEPYHDPGVGAFGLENAVFAVGDTFLEVVAPVKPDTTAGRYLERRGGDSGYMAIFQVPSLEESRSRLADLGVRVVWTADLGDIAGTHLHPKDVPGAIVSLDWANPASSWRWAGPPWTASVPPHPPGGMLGLTIEVSDPPAAARRWADVLGATAEADGVSVTVTLEAGRQELCFVSARHDGVEGIVQVTLAMADVAAEGVRDIGGVRFVIVPATSEGDRL